MSETSDTAGQISRATALFLQERTKFDAGTRADAPSLGSDLIELLDCHISPFGKRRAKGWQQREAAAYTEAQECLPRLLCAIGDPVDEIFILLGLYRNKCWSRCLESRDDAYTLAMALLGFLSFSVTHHEQESSFATNDILGLLNEWLAPTVPWTVLPGDYAACRKMFSGPWCDLMLPADCDAVETTIPDSRLTAWFLVKSDRPPFLPGLCSAQEAPIGMQLPDLGALS